MYYFTPNISFTSPLKNLGTFFTTIVICNPLLYFRIEQQWTFFQQHSQVIPTNTIVIPIMNNQPENGSNITSKTPIPKPIKHTANVFLNSFNIYFLPL